MSAQAIGRMTGRLRIVIAEDHPIFRDGLRRALAGAADLELAGEADDGVGALAMIRTRTPDVAVLDIGLPGLDGCEVAARVRAERLPVELVFLTVCDDVGMFSRALELDVKGYLLKDATAEEIVRCLRAAGRGQHYASPAMTTYLVERTHRATRLAARVPALQQLTAHERAILVRVAQGKRSKEIAAELGIAPKTVDGHRANVCRKLNLHGNHALARFAIQHRDDL
jgi:two-component system nitrate/nitrite response regulator NarL